MKITHRTMEAGHLASARGGPAPTPRVAGTPRGFLFERHGRGLSRLTSALYLIVALAAPFLLYFGPDVLSPAAPVIAAAAADGRLTLRASNQHALDAAVVHARDVIGHP
ncbi:MAG: hypothetical protein ACM3JC_05690 [Rudaea sp.]